MEEKKLTHGIGIKDKVGYAMGDFAGLLTFGLVSSFLQLFYTDTLGIAPAKIAILFLIARIWDAVNDPMWGAFIDSRKPTKHGRFRPYILGASILFMLSGILLFLDVPTVFNTLFGTSMSWSEGQYLVYAYITYIFFGMMYTGTNIPFGSLAAVITDDPIERSSLSMWRSIGSGFGSVPPQMILPLLVYTTTVVDGVKVKNLDPMRMFVGSAVLAVLGFVAYYVHFKMTTERIAPPVKQESEKYSVGKTVKYLIKNRPFIVLCIVSMLLIAFQMYTQTNYNYIFKNYYNASGLYSLVMVCTYLPMACFLPFMGKLIRKHGKKELCGAGLIFASAINFVMYFIRFTPLVTNPYIFLALILLSGTGQTFLVLEVWALVMDVIDYQETLSGRRDEGTCYSFFSFTRKLGQTLAGTGSSALLGVIGYDVTKVNVGQSAEVLDRLYTVTTLIPAIVLAVMALLLIFCYPLSKKKLEEVYAKTR